MRARSTGVPGATTSSPHPSAKRISSTAKFLFPLMLAGSLALGSAGDALADNECGVEVVGPDVINCPAGSYAGGISYPNSDGSTLNLNNPGISVPGTAVGVRDIGASTTTNAITVNGTSFNFINTTVSQVHGIRAQNDGLGAATATLTSGTISTTGDTSFGTVGFVSNPTSTATATGIMNGGSIHTSGNSSLGLAGWNKGQGDAIATLVNGQVSTTGALGYGVVAWIDTTTGVGNANASMSGGSIDTANSDAPGLVAWERGLVRRRRHSTAD